MTQISEDGSYKMAKKSAAENKPTIKIEQSPGNIKKLIAAFSSKNGLKRKKARLVLVDIGKPAVPYLIEAMRNPNTKVRWEAVKTLGAIGDPRCGPDIVKALTDKKFEIRWLAAEALIGLKRSAIKPLLKALIDRPDSWGLYQGAHHILHSLEREHLLNESCINLLNELRGMDEDLSIPVAAEAALRSISKSEK